MTNLEKAAEFADGILRNDPRAYADGRRTWARYQVMAAVLEGICGEQNEHGTPRDEFDEADPEAEQRAETAAEAEAEWLGESWANRY